MLNYIYYGYYGYVAGYTVFYLQEYWGLFKIAHTACNYTYSATKVIYQLVKPKESIDLLEWNSWDMCNMRDFKKNSDN
jgi:hypothetical protein